MSRRSRITAKRRLKRPVKWILAVIAVVVVAGCGYRWLNVAQPAEASPGPVPVVASEGKPVPQVSSRAFVLLDKCNNTVMAQKDAERKIYPASLVKMMTSIIAIEENHDLEQKVTLPAELFSYLLANNASVAGFSSGEEVAVKDLLYGAMLPSGGDAALGLAYSVSDSEEAFVRLMNRKAKALGMNNTHFTNATGLHDANQYSTVSDLAMLMQYALQHDTFKKVFSTTRYTAYSGDMHEEGLPFSSTFFAMTDDRLQHGRFLGGKTGSTDEAGLNLASAVEVNGNVYILVSAGAADDGNKNQYEDAITVYNSYL